MQRTKKDDLLGIESLPQVALEILGRKRSNAVRDAGDRLTRQCCTNLPAVSFRDGEHVYVARHQPLLDTAHIEHLKVQGESLRPRCCERQLRAQCAQPRIAKITDANGCSGCSTVEHDRTHVQVELRIVRIAVLLEQRQQRGIEMKAVELDVARARYDKRAGKTQQALWGCGRRSGIVRRSDSSMGYPLGELPVRARQEDRDLCLPSQFAQQVDVAQRPAIVDLLERLVENDPNAHQSTAARLVLSCERQNSPCNIEVMFAP